MISRLRSMVLSFTHPVVSGFQLGPDVGLGEGRRGNGFGHRTASDERRLYYPWDKDESPLARRSGWSRLLDTVKSIANHLGACRTNRRPRASRSDLME